VVSFSGRLSGKSARCPSCSEGFVAPQITFSPEGRFQRGRQLVQQGDLEGGYALINQLCRTHPLFQSPLLFYAESFFQRGRFPEALKFYRKAIQLGRCDQIDYANAAHAACESREFVEARRLLGLAEKHVGRSHFTAEMRITSGRVAAQLGDTKVALQHLRRAVRAGATDPAKYENDRLLIPGRTHQTLPDLPEE
jgi:tetratricopeptide (TPR) repeat protein